MGVILMGRHRRVGRIKVSPRADQGLTDSMLGLMANPGGFGHVVEGAKHVPARLAIHLTLLEHDVTDGAPEAGGVEEGAAVVAAIDDVVVEGKGGVASFAHASPGLANARKKEEQRKLIWRQSKRCL